VQPVIDVRESLQQRLISWCNRSRSFLFWGSLCGSYFIYFYFNNLQTVPISGRSQFAPPITKWETDWYSELIKPGFPVRTNHRINRVGSRLLHYNMDILKDDPDSWNFLELRSKVPNAASVPGNLLLVYSGIFDEVVTREDDLAAVLAHEMAHQIADHHTEKYSWWRYFIGPGLLLSGLTKGFTFALKFFLVSGLLVTLPISRRIETEADYIGLYMLGKAGYNYHGMSRVMNRLDRVQKQAAGGEPPDLPWFLRTHPTGEERVKKIEEWIPEIDSKIRETEVSKTRQSFFKGRM
jgi:Zn-dependent protease with chaperone function